MMDLSVVVLPAPLRPSSVTTSPERTSNVTPCNTWDSPYQACSPSTVRSGASLAMADPKIGFAHAGVGGDRVIVTFRQDAPAREHRDAVGQIGNDAEIVLDHQHGAIGGDRFDQRADASDILVSHPGHRLVEQHELGIERERGGDLERALAAIGQLRRRPMRMGGEIHISDQLHRLLVEGFKHPLGAPEIEGGAALALQGDAHVLEYAQVRKYRRDLERANHAQPRHIGWRQRRDVTPVVDDPPTGGTQKLGQEIETGRLAGAVWTNERMNGPAGHAQIDLADRYKAGEFLGQILRFEDDSAAHDATSLRPASLKRSMSV